jgi:hypothetical protein
VAVDEPQQMVLGDVISQAEIVEQRLRTGVLTHHDQQASENGDQAQHQQQLSSAYNFAALTSQAPTQGLFQQLPLIAKAKGTAVSPCLFAIADSRSPTAV